MESERFEIVSKCHKVKVMGHPRSLSGDASRCTECGELTSIYHLVPDDVLVRMDKDMVEGSERYNALATPLMNLFSEIHRINDKAGE